jgi:nitrite reductase/ring-hydroxylating ferredoxin subunit
MRVTSRVSTGGTSRRVNRLIAGNTVRCLWHHARFILRNGEALLAKQKQHPEGVQLNQKV